MNVRTRAHVCLRACVCLYSYVSACMYSCAHVCVWLSRHACLPVLVLLCVPVHAYTPACVCYVYVYTCMQTSVYVCVSVCSHVCQASVYVYKNTLVSVHCDWLPALLLTSLPWKWGKSSHRNIFNLSKQQGEIQLSSPPWPEPLESLRVAAFDRQGTAMLLSRTQRHRQSRKQRLESLIPAPRVWAAQMLEGWGSISLTEDAPTSLTLSLQWCLKPEDPLFSRPSRSRSEVAAPPHSSHTDFRQWGPNMAQLWRTPGERGRLCTPASSWAHPPAAPRWGEQATFNLPPLL